DCFGKPAPAEKHLEIDGATAALAAAATIEQVLPRIDGEAIIAGAADRTSTNEFATGLAEVGSTRLRDRDHVDGACLGDQRVPLVGTGDGVEIDAVGEILVEIGVRELGCDLEVIGVVGVSSGCRFAWGKYPCKAWVRSEDMRAGHGASGC